MRDLLCNMNLKTHLNRPVTPEYKKLTLWKPSDEFLHCCIESAGCRFSRDRGACIMCDYGIGRRLTPDELKAELEEKLRPQMSSLSMILFGSYGSVFDTEEVSEECLNVVLDFVAVQRVQTIIFETHCCTITEKVLEKLKRKLCDIGKRVIIEMGFESSDTFVLENCLNKILDLDQLCRAMDLIHKYGMDVSLNVFLGAPFLDERDQLETAAESVKWAFDKGADSIVIFPCNVKPFTLLYKLYQNNLYHPISHWLMAELLARIPEDYLGKVSFSWYGDRKNFYENDQYPLIPPKDCKHCHKKIFDFYQGFMKASSVVERKNLLMELFHERAECDCHDQVLRKIHIRKKRMEKEEISRILEDV